MKLHSIGMASLDILRQASKSPKGLILLLNRQADGNQVLEMHWNKLLARNVKTQRQTYMD